MSTPHPSIEYALVGCVAASGSLIFTPVARRVAIAWGAVARPRDRDVHAVATPRMGGVALLLGLCMALFVAARLPALSGAFNNGPEMAWILTSGAIICAIGVIDDRYELDSLTKLAGQVLATGIMVTVGGVQLADVYLPGLGTVSLGRDLAIPVTILLTVLTINAVNFIDGLDGLAAGVTAIAAGAFFLFSYHLAQRGLLDIAATPTLLTAALAGTCIGFLPHNFSPARIFMGDSGSMLVGLMLSASVTSLTGQFNYSNLPAKAAFPVLLPLLLPLAVLAVPFVDLLLAVVRRTRAGRSPFSPDKLHLHHRLLEIGHSTRRAVLLMYAWSALMAFAGVGLSITNSPGFVVTAFLTGIAVVLTISALPRLRRGTAGL